MNLGSIDGIDDEVSGGDGVHIHSGCDENSRADETGRRQTLYGILNGARRGCKGGCYEGIRHDGGCDLERICLNCAGQKASIRIYNGSGTEVELRDAIGVYGRGHVEDRCTYSEGRSECGGTY